MTTLKSRLPLFILALGAILRIATVGASSIWYDESVTLYRSTLPFMQIYTNPTDNSGTLILDLCMRLLMPISHSLWLLRMPSLLAALLSLFLVWKIMRTLDFSLRQQVWACVFVTFLPGLLWLSNDARAYSILSCVFLAAIYFAIEGRLLGLTACLGLFIYCHNIGPAYAFAAWLIALYLRPWKAQRLIFSGCMAWLAWIPGILHLLLINVHIFGIMQPWMPVITLNWFVNSAVVALFVSRVNWFNLAIFLIMLISLGLFWSRTWKCRPRNTLLIASLVPLLFLLGVGAAWNNVINYRTIAPTVTPFLLFLSWEFGHTPATLYRSICAGAWTILLVAGLLLWHPAARGGHIDQVARTIRSQWRIGDLIIYQASVIELPFSYYLSDLPHFEYRGIASCLVNEPGIQLPDTGDPARAKRIWLLQDRDILITPAEQVQFEALYPHGADPLWNIQYVQASDIDVYLIDRSEE
jgi:hypothetical protein